MLHKNDLVQIFMDGCKTPSNFKIGVEQEQFVFKNFDTDPKRLSYDEPHGMLDLLLSFKKFGYEEVLENDVIIGLYHPITQSNISLEPGGQFELSGSPKSTPQEVFDEFKEHFENLESIAQTLNIKGISLGYDHYSKRDDVPWMPKQRYNIMKKYMPTVGSHGIDMMQRTCTVQVNLDYSSEEDMAKKMRTAMAIQPFISATFANARSQPFQTPNSTSNIQLPRTFIWQHTDNNRCGILPCVFDPNFGFEQYVDYLLDVPMYFIKRHNTYIDVAGASFKDFIKGRLSGFSHECATTQDFIDHITVAFPEVRLKTYIEVRGADGGDLEHIKAITNFWHTLFYKNDYLSLIYDLIANWTYDEINSLYHNIVNTGLLTSFKEKTVKKWSQEFFTLMNLPYPTSLDLR